jgi:predicted phage terminase large subunit-like protein
MIAVAAKNPMLRAAKMLELKKSALILKARADFRVYRRLINPRLKGGWFRCAIETSLMQWWASYVAGDRPVLLLSTPPQHGKSILIIDFISWVAGQDPDLRTIFSSFSDRLGVRANLKLQRIYDSSIYRQIFPDTKINTSNVVTISGQYLRNREILEYVGKTGYFRNTTVGGPVTGESLDIGIIDDPVKGREEANSPTMREKVWDWYTDDFGTRFSDVAGLILIMTRWHIDDLAGRIVENDPRAKVLTFKAIAEEDEEHRVEGEALFPELKSLSFLLDKKAVMRSASWKSLYQGSPIIDEGDMFRPDSINIIDVLPANIKQSVRYWDKAGTDGGGCYTAGTLLYLLDDNRVVIGDVVRDQVAAGRRERMIRQTAEIDGVKVEVWVEEEPGSGGKESAENTIRNLVGYRARSEKVTGSKETRAEPFAAYVESGNVSMIRAAWNKPFIDEMRLFPNGKYKDQIDAASGAYNKLTLGIRSTGWLDWIERKALEKEAQDKADREGAAA